MIEWQHPRPGLDTDPVMFQLRPDTTDLIVVEEVWREGVYALGPDELDGRRVLDLGANIGAFTVWAALCGATVVAVEPDPGNLAGLRSNVALNVVDHAVTVIEAGIGPVAGWLSMTGPGGGVQTRPELSHVEGAARAVTWAWLVDQHGPFDVVKLDTEGAEWATFAGMLDSPTTMPAVLVAEFHGEGIVGDGVPPPHDERARLVWRLAEYGTVQVMGRPSVGGMLRFWRYDD